MSVARAALGLLMLVSAAAGQNGLAHIAVGGGWSTVITLVNRSPKAVRARVTVNLHNDDGSPLSLALTTTQNGNSKTTTASSVSADVDLNATLLISIGDQISSTVVGWAEVRSSDFGGYAIFRYAPPMAQASEGTVPLQIQPASTVALPYDNTTGFVMGVALANLSPMSAGITAVIFDDGGKMLGTQNLMIPGSGHMSFVLPTLIPLTAGRRGVVEFRASGAGGLAGLGLRFSPFGTFTSIPTL